MAAAEWRRWRELRLRALADSPEAFGSTHAAESLRPDPSWRERTAVNAVSEERALFVAVDGDRWVGSAGVSLEEGPLGLVFSMWVAPEARRTGVGRRLLAAVEEWALAHGAESLRLLVVSEQAAARALYESFGFRATGHTEPMDRDPSVVEVEMVLRRPGTNIGTRRR